jgi:hypothetical protein
VLAAWKASFFSFRTSKVSRFPEIRGIDAENCHRKAEDGVIRRKLFREMGFSFFH